MKSNQFTKPHHFTVFALLISLATALSVGAQSVEIRSQAVRVTVSDSATNYLILGVATNSPSTLTNFVDLDTNVTALVDWSISGLPAGVGYTTFNYNQTAHDNTNDFGLNLVLNTTNVAQGEHIINLNATGGAENHFLLTLQSGRMWDGTTNVSTVWSSPSSWVGGIPPGASDDVLFAQLGAQPNTNNFFTNSLVTANTEIASLRFSQNNGNARYHTIGIDPGVTLRVSGTKGLRLLKDTTTSGAQMDVGFVGNGGRLVVSNRNANIATLVDNQQAHRLDMSTLGTFEADVNRIGFGDDTLYPNLTNLIANGFSGNATFLRVRRLTPIISFARTNIIRANYVDPFNYTNNVDRKYAFSWSRTHLEGTTANNPIMHLGFSNLFLCDSIEIGGFGATGQSIGGINTGLDFNTGLVRITNVVPNVSTNFTTNTSFYAYFRNTNGTSRVSLFAIGDSGGNDTNYAGANVKVWANFANVVGGTVNALVDRLYIGRDKATNSTSYNTQAGLIFGAGLFDVNTAILGYQQNTGATNVAYAQGTITVTNTAIFKVNNSIELGYTTENPANTVAEPQNNRGIINIGPGGTVMAKTILVGGVSKASAGNAINMNSGATLIVSNKIAGPDQFLSTLSVSGGSTLTLHLNGTNTGHYVYATNLTVAANQTLNIASVANLPIPPSGTNVPLFFFTTGGGLNFSVVNMPSPMRGTIVPGATANENDLNIITNAPKNLVWRGAVNNNWNLTDKNWLDTATGLATNYINGDAVTFDDLVSAPDTVNLAVSLIPDSITVSNGTGNPSFVFSGTGTILGGSLTKNGSGSLAIDSATSIPAQVNQGTFTGVGSVSSVVVASGAVLDFSGTISPSGVTCAGIASLRGTTTGGLTVQTGGVVTNYSTATDGFNAQSDALLVNVTNANLMTLGGSGTISSNATFINGGNIGAALKISTLTVSGVFKDLGNGANNIYLSTLNINGGTGTNNINAGTFIPGGDGIGTTTIKSPGVGGGNFPGRVQMGTGSTNIFKVNVDSTPVYTILQAAWTDFGPSVGEPSFNGGFLQITNVGTSSLSAGQSFGMFKYEDGTTPIFFGSTNSYPIMSPTNAGTGLAWDLSNLKPGGLVAVKSLPTTGTNITFFAFLSSRTNNAGVTNATIVTDLQWPSNYIAWSGTGWHLEEQNGNRTNGLRPDPTNWSPILGTYFTNRIIFTNNVTSNSVTFWRMVYP